MADARALLRQQRAARRINHPLAAYLDNGKLVCTLCQEYIKIESLWDTHLHGASHRQRLQRQQQQAQASTRPIEPPRAGFIGDVEGERAAPSAKRKHDEPGPVAENGEDANDERRKRPKPDDATTLSEQRRLPGMGFGLEVQIPSRPATPGGTSSNTGSGTPMSLTPKTAPLGRSPLVTEESASQPEPALPNGPSHTQPNGPSSEEQVDEALWSAFEADLLQPSAVKTLTNPEMNPDAVILAPAMTAEEVAAKSEEEEQARRRALVDIQLEDEKEEATRKLEEEFEVMEELEARARRLREQREALRARVMSAGGRQGVAAVEKGDRGGKATTLVQEEEEDEDDDEDDDDDDDDDDWDGFRFRA